ncbi:MAG TPA: beta-propeller fold lactonase family protein [Candidatus Baltobacteraceae bacterium]|nr:beta-propeller fold lactonase family protein [Candidatus Baltobacteraceae bacterium]
MNALRVLVVIEAALFGLAGCSGPGIPASLSPSAYTPASAASSEELFVANHTFVTVYAANGKLLRKISTGLSAPAALALDANRNLYVANRKNSTVTVYRAGTTVLLRTISSGVSQPRALAFDKHGNLYVGNKGNGTVTVYAPQMKLPILTIANVDPHVLIFDQLDRLYVGNPGLNEILVYEPPSTKAERIVHTHNGPLGISVDQKEFLYCVNNTNVTVYTPTATTPSSRIVDGINFPSTLARFESSLYVANWGVNPTLSSITVYNLKNLALVQTIRRGIGDPLALAVDRTGNLFVANGAYSTVTVYAAGKTSPLHTISTAIREPVALAIAP